MVSSARTRSEAAFDAADVARTVDRMAHQIIESAARPGEDVVLLGIPTRGVPLARRLAGRIAVFGDVQLGVGAVDSTLYRDDLRLRGVRALAETIEPPGGITGKLVILVDDVLFSGRPGRPWPPRAADPGRLRRQEPADVPAADRSGLPQRDRRHRRRLPGRSEQ
jgi:pyrimidine operon attenuation protein/uracil phosphoribosyltransferase